MSEVADPHRRAGSALLLAVVISAVVGICTITLWRVAAAGPRSVALERAHATADALADSARFLALEQVGEGAWHTLDAPGTSLRIGGGGAGRGRWSAQLGRSSWETLVARGLGDQRSGVPAVSGRSDRRTVIPLVSPIDIPVAALTGVSSWLLDPAATVEVPLPTGPERTCRPPGTVAPTRTTPFPTRLDSSAFPAVDPDTVRDSLVGAYRLTRDRIRQPLRIVGMVVFGSDARIEADLRLSGVLIARGSVQPAGGRLDVTGAVLTGDAGGGQSGLGPGDRVQYDACAIRRAVERVTSPGPTATWKHLSPF